jgi:superfamily I DNA and/or RNA helicase
VEEAIAGLGESGKEKARVSIANWHRMLPWADDVRRDFAESVQVFGVTCLRAPTLWELLRTVEFDWVIVDEAAKATDTELLVPLVHGRRFILVGDQRQLPPYLDREIEDAMAFEGIPLEEARTSLFEKLFEAIPSTNRVTLQTQYRMHPTIGSFVGELFYDDIGGLRSGVPETERPLDLELLKNYRHRVFWMDIAQGEEKADGTSYHNVSEALRINRVLEIFNADLATKGINYSIGVITPYAAQVDVLRQEIIPAARKWTNLDIDVSTVDAFQGRENDITLYSMVRTKPGSLRFVEDEKRLNVSFSRAMRALLIFGHRDTAQSSVPFAKALRLLPQENILHGDSEQAHG